MITKKEINSKLEKIAFLKEFAMNNQNRKKDRVDAGILALKLRAKLLNLIAPKSKEL